MSTNRVRTMSIVFGVVASMLLAAPGFAAPRAGGAPSSGDTGGGPAVPPANAAPETQQPRDKMALATAWTAENVGLSGGAGTLAATRAIAPSGTYADLLSACSAKYGPASVSAAMRSASLESGAAHYNGHPSNRTIGHWVTGVGYDGSGATIIMLDPASGLSGYGSSLTRFTYATSGFYGFTAARYDVW